LGRGPTVAAPPPKATAFTSGEFVCVQTGVARFERGYIARVLANGEAANGSPTNQRSPAYKVWLVDRGVMAVVEHDRVRKLAHEAMAARNFFAIRATVCSVRVPETLRLHLATRPTWYTMQLSSIRPTTSSGWSSATVDALRLAVQLSDDRTHEEYSFRVGAFILQPVAFARL